MTRNLKKMSDVELMDEYNAVSQDIVHRGGTGMSEAIRRDNIEFELRERGYANLPPYQEGFEILMDYFNVLPDEIKKEVHEKLQEIGL